MFRLNTATGRDWVHLGSEPWCQAGAAQDGCGCHHAGTDLQSRTSKDESVVRDIMCERAWVVVHIFGGFMALKATAIYALQGYPAVST